MNKRTTKTPLIELTGVTRSYDGSGGSATWALRNVSLHIHAGEFVCITGPSGSGKSTLLNILGCLDRPSGGSYRLDGRDVQDLSADSLAWLRREVFGFVFQSYHLIATATAQGNIELPGRYAGMGKAARRMRAHKLLAQLDLSDRAEHFPSDLSGGEQQRTCIARALMNGGRVILADEPTGALDQHNGEKILSALEALAGKGHTVIMVSHNPEIARRAQRRVELRDGRVVSDENQPADVSGGPPFSSPVARISNRRTTTGPGGAMEALFSGLASLRNLMQEKRRLRGILSVASIAVAIWWIITLTSIVEGITQVQLELINKMGADHITLHSGGPLSAGDPAIGLTREDAQAIEGQIANVRTAVPRLGQRMTVQKGSLNMQASVRGDLPRPRPDTSVADSQRLETGNAISVTDNDRLDSVAVIGPGVRDRLFGPSEDPVGQYLTINNLPFRIKGVALAERLAVMARSEEARESIRAQEEDFVDVPYDTAASLLFGTINVRLLDIWVDQPSLINETAQAIGDLLTRRHGSAGFTMFYQAEQAAEATKTRNMLNLFVFAIGGIALLAGGLGVMTIMLMSVTGRRQEIGMRMAIGARRADILKQFLMEATVTVTAGGLLGIAASAVSIPALTLLGIPAQVSAWLALAALACAMCTGILFGVFPARRAARLDPVIALAAT